ncbi:hypothetical protein BDF20DRAFT_878980 [Mycotypha africana]|uniref:uncharacterized protein n=1 Tax=Mycotypha africana TaxID=64632 RepID=UPI0022FFC567|nr:uncharacterized protein BDF20DRAFT_878980 [Mycotypha africana]KAI8975481.1 hypothetical protein BDF20DRAFT_878980 [Mycotypha africana]
MKKMGAGIGNWGVLGDELPNVEDIARAQVEAPYQQYKGTKLNLVDRETFNTMRSSSSATSTPTDEHESFPLEQAST